MTESETIEIAFRHISKTLRMLAKCEARSQLPDVLQDLRADLIKSAVAIVTQAQAAERDTLLVVAALSQTEAIIDVFPDAETATVALHSDVMNDISRAMPGQYFELLHRKGGRLDCVMGLPERLAFLKDDAGWQAILMDGRVPCEWTLLVSPPFIAEVKNPHIFATYLEKNAASSTNFDRAADTVTNAIARRDGIVFVLAILLSLPIRVPTFDARLHAKATDLLSAHSRLDIIKQFGPLEDFVASKSKHREAEKLLHQDRLDAFLERRV
jgi:hypothetical protein